MCRIVHKDPHKEGAKPFIHFDDDEDIKKKDTKNK